ncbi:MAG: hypothetical protein ABL898_13850 [Hyphomicrobiaceae bacterium]
MKCFTNLEFRIQWRHLAVQHLPVLLVSCADKVAGEDVFDATVAIARDDPALVVRTMTKLMRWQGVIERLWSLGVFNAFETGRRERR